MGVKLCWMMESFVSKNCPECAKAGRNSQLILRQLNFEEALEICSNNECFHPFGGDSSSYQVIARSADVFYSEQDKSYPKRKFSKISKTYEKFTHRAHESPKLRLDFISSEMLAKEVKVTKNVPECMNYEVESNDKSNTHTLSDLQDSLIDSIGDNAIDCSDFLQNFDEQDFNFWSDVSLDDKSKLSMNNINQQSTINCDDRKFNNDIFFEIDNYSFFNSDSDKVVGSSIDSSISAVNCDIYEYSSSSLPPSCEDISVPFNDEQFDVNQNTFESEAFSLENCVKFSNPNADENRFNKIQPTSLEEFESNTSNSSILDFTQSNSSKETGSISEKKTKDLIDYFAHWKSIDSSSWLDVTLCFIVHSKNIASVLIDLEEKSIVRLICVAFKQACSLISEEIEKYSKHLKSTDGLIENPSQVLESSMVDHLVSPVDAVLKLSSLPDFSFNTKSKIDEVLNNCRRNTIGYFNQKMSLECDMFDTPLCGLQTLLNESPVLKELSEISYSWKMICCHCAHQFEKRCQNIIPTFPNAPKDFTMLAPCYIDKCVKCAVPQQRMNMIFNRLPRVILLHFLDGLSIGSISNYDFIHKGTTFAVTGIIHYCSVANRFTAWIREIKDGKWMKCDDNNLSYFSKDSPPLDLKANIILWEQIGERNLCEKIYINPVDDLLTPPNTPHSDGSSPSEYNSCSNSSESYDLNYKNASLNTAQRTSSFLAEGFGDDIIIRNSSSQKKLLEESEKWKRMDKIRAKMTALNASGPLSNRNSFSDKMKDMSSSYDKVSFRQSKLFDTKHSDLENPLQSTMMTIVKESLENEIEVKKIKMTYSGYRTNGVSRMNSNYDSRKFNVPCNSTGDHSFKNLSPKKNVKFRSRPNSPSYVVNEKKQFSNHMIFKPTSSKLGKNVSLLFDWPDDQFPTNEGIKSRSYLDI